MPKNQPTPAMIPQIARMTTLALSYPVHQIIHSVQATAKNTDATISLI